MTWVLWNPVSDHLEIVLVLVQDRCTVCTKRTIGSDIAFNAPMVILGDDAQLEPRFSPCADSANLVTRLVRGLRRTYHSLRDRFGGTRWNSKVTWVM